LLEGLACAATRIRTIEEWDVSQQRIAQQVLDDHLAVSFNGTVEEDL
jgi:hypothetical protein